MAYFRTCPECGARLDPGEACNCGDELKRGNGRLSGANNNSAQLSGDSKDFDLKTYRKTKCIKQQNVVDILAAQYPKFRKSIESLCENPDYGVALRTGAVQLLLDTFGETSSDATAAEIAPKTENRRLKGKFTFRMENALKGRFKHYYNADGFKTFQAFAYFWVNVYIKAKENEIALPFSAQQWVESMMESNKKSRPLEDGNQKKHK